MGTAKRVIVVTTEGDFQRIAEPVALTTPVLSDNGTKPVWIEGDDLGGSHPDLAAHDALGLATDSELGAHISDAADAHDASAISFTPNGSIAATDVQAAIQEVRDEAGGGGAPDDATYLTKTAHAGLSAEEVVGATPGGDLGGTWAAPTVAKSSRDFGLTAVINPAQLTADTDNWSPTGLATANVIDVSTDAARSLSGIDAASAYDGRVIVLRNVGAQQLNLLHASALSTAANRFWVPGAPTSVPMAQKSMVILTYSGGDSRWMVMPGLAFGAAAPPDIGTAAAGTASAVARRDHVHATGAGTPSTQAFGDAAAVGTGPAAAMTDHKHAMPALGTGSTNAAAGNHAHAGSGTPTHIGVHAYNSANIAIVTATDTVVTLDSERYDTDGFHSTSSNTNRLTVPAGLAGYYLVVFNCDWAAGVAGIREARIRRNVATVNAYIGIQTVYNASVGDGTRMSVSAIVLLGVGDYVEALVRQVIGVNLNLQAANNYGIELMMTRIGV